MICLDLKSVSADPLGMAHAKFGTQSYEDREISLAHAEERRINQQPLADRQAARAEFAYSLEREPDRIGERVDWLLAGNYGYGPMLRAKQVLAAKRSNRAAALSQLAAIYDWMCPADFARQAYLKLTSAQKAAVDAAVKQVIAEYDAGGRE